MKLADLKRQLIESLVDELDQGANYGEIKDSLDSKDLEGFCKELDFLLKDDDPKAKALYETLKKGWQKEYGDVKAEVGVIDVKDFHPTQADIFTKKTIIPFLKEDSQSVEAVLKSDSPTVSLGQRLVVCRVGGKNYIIDGHHRWSKVCLFNPQAKMDAYIIDGDRMFSSADDVLKFAQGSLALASRESPIHEQDNDDTNIYDIDKKKFYKIVTDNVTDEILNIISSSPVAGGKVKDRKSLCEYLWNNKQKLPKPLLDHDREYMPQFPERKDAEQLSECRHFVVNNYKGNLLESLKKFNKTNPKMKIVKVRDLGGRLRILAR